MHIYSVINSMITNQPNATYWDTAQLEQLAETLRQLDADLALLAERLARLEDFAREL